MYHIRNPDPLVDLQGTVSYPTIEAAQDAADAANDLAPRSKRGWIVCRSVKQTVDERGWQPVPPPEPPAPPAPNGEAPQG